MSSSSYVFRQNDRAGTDFPEPAIAGRNCETAGEDYYPLFFWRDVHLPPVKAFCGCSTNTIPVQGKGPDASSGGTPFTTSVNVLFSSTSSRREEPV